jgi:hypothetical protein
MKQHPRPPPIGVVDLSAAMSLNLRLEQDKYAIVIASQKVRPIRGPCRGSVAHAWCWRAKSQYTAPETNKCLDILC